MLTSLTSLFSEHLIYSTYNKDILISLLSICEISALDHVTDYAVGLESCCLDLLQGSLD